MRLYHHVVQLIKPFHVYVTLSSRQAHCGHTKCCYHFTDEATKLGEWGTWTQSRIRYTACQIVSFHIYWRFLQTSSPPYASKIVGSLRSTLAIVGAWELRIKGNICQWRSVCRLSEEKSFSREQESSWSGLWLSWGSASSLPDMVPGKRGAGLAAVGDVGKVVISMLSVIHPHGPWGPIFRLVCLPRKGQA